MSKNKSDALAQYTAVAFLAWLGVRILRKEGLVWIQENIVKVIRGAKKALKVVDDVLFWTFLVLLIFLIVKIYTDKNQK